jgi:predicted small lipoprotein YifL
MRSRFALLAAVLALSTLAASGQQRMGPLFRPDDPLRIDDDRAIDVGELPEYEESDIYDFLSHTFTSPGSSDDIPALNVNTVDEVPDSSWFTNRHADGLPAAGVLARGPDTLPSLDISGWPVSEGKGDGASPGFRVRGPDGRNYQLKFDPPSNPEMSTAAEVIGAAFYHAFGYNSIEMYLVEFDGSNLTMLPGAVMKRGGKERPLTRGDIEAVLAASARSANGKYRATARRYPAGDVVGSFRYYGTRSDDPNDIYPHEHRRELRGSRVFAAWLNHDDSRGINSKDIVVSEGGKRYVKHFMYDFNSILGSGNQKPQKYRSGNEYRVDAGEALKTFLTLGLYVRPWARVDYPDVPPAVGRFESSFFDPLEWKPEYPQAAYDRMRPEDAFWAARIVARFDEPAVRAIVGKGRYTEPRAVEYIVRTLMERREKVLRAWLNVVLPIVDPALGGEGLTFRNAAVDAGVAPAPAGYRVTWHAYDNATGERRQSGDAVNVAPGGAAALPHALSQQDFVMAEIAVDGGEPGWHTPVRAYFRRQPSAWQLVGLFRS